jgi:hypothetical protein
MTEEGRRYEQRQRDMERRAKAARQGFLHEIGVDLMNAWNRDLHDPSLMAVMGHDTTFGFAFNIERDGQAVKVEVKRDIDG